MHWLSDRRRFVRISRPGLMVGIYWLGQPEFQVAAGSRLDHRRVPAARRARGPPLVHRRSGAAACCQAGLWAGRAGGYVGKGGLSRQGLASGSWRPGGPDDAGIRQPGFKAYSRPLAELDVLVNF